MDSYIELPDCSIRYRLSGHGPVVLLIHGYLESLDIWDDITSELEANYTVLAVDMPGHGKSACQQQNIGMELMADSVSAAISSLAIETVFLIGHSMGGYVALAFAEHYSNRVSGLCLLHSSPNPDSAEKRQSRLADIELVRNGGKAQLVNSSIPRLYANQNLVRMSRFITRAIAIARSTPDAGIVGALNGMAERRDRNHVIDTANFPVFFVFGRYDNLISLETVSALAERHKKARTVILNGSGHMGFAEEKDQTVSAIKSFLTQVFMCD